MDTIVQFLKAEIESLTFEEVETNVPLISTKILDSITVVDLAVAIEDEYKIKVPLNEVTEEEFDTIERMAKYIQNKI
ncbi:MAG: acyl carrier protein [Flavobacteriales bacterium]|nr:acyl carrier protein [Flavobacteriales bacterium]